MADEFILKDHLKVYYKTSYSGSWTLIDNYNVISIDIDRQVESQARTIFTNTPGTARIILRRNLVTGTNIDESYQDPIGGWTKYDYIKVVATVKPDTDPHDVNIFWGRTKQSTTTFSPRAPRSAWDLSEFNYEQVVLECVDMLETVNVAAGPSSHANGFPEDRFVTIMNTFALPSIPYSVEYSGATAMPAESNLDTSVGEQLQEIQQSDLGFVACDYINERISFYGRYYLPDLLDSINTWESSSLWTGFSDQHVNTDEHFCYSDLSLSTNTSDWIAWYVLVKKLDPTVKQYSMPVGTNRGNGLTLTINTRNIADLTQVGRVLDQQADYTRLDNVTADVVRRSDGRLNPLLVVLQPVIDFARVVIHREGTTVNKAFVITRMHHRIDADNWQVDLSGIRLNVDTVWPSDGWA